MKKARSRSRQERPAGKRAAVGLAEYQRKRDFSKTSEPRGAPAMSAGSLSFVVQKHAARRLHYDFRLELDGVLKSWAVPKGPSLDPSDKRLAVQTEDHPLEYAAFEGRIPEGEYGAGKVVVWDRGRWTPVGDPHRGLAGGKLKFRLQGGKLSGGWTLVKLRGRADGGGKANWLLIKERDETVRSAPPPGGRSWRAPVRARCPGARSRSSPRGRNPAGSAGPGRTPRRKPRSPA